MVLILKLISPIIIDKNDMKQKRSQYLQYKKHSNKNQNVIISYNIKAIQFVNLMRTDRE